MRMRITSLNIKGRMSGNINKWQRIPQIMRDNRIGVMAIQEAHITNDVKTDFNNLFGNALLLIHSPNPETRIARGVAFVINKSLVRTDDIKLDTIVPGRALLLSTPWKNDTRLTFLNIYMPNAPVEAREFWTMVREGLRGISPAKPDVMLGDFNIVEDALDRIPCSPGDPQSTERLRSIRNEFNLIDGWRVANPEGKGYTWMRESDRYQSRLDRIYIRQEMFNECTEWTISIPPIPTDHNIVSANIATSSDPTIGRGRWVIPTQLVKNKKTKPIIQQLGLKLQRQLVSGLNSLMTYFASEDEGLRGIN